MAQQEEPRIEEAQPERRHLDPKRVLAAMGPGMVAALAGADAGGVATYSSAGALFGYGQLWTVPVMCLLLIVAQETAARMGCVTGKGFASLIREQFGVRMSTLAMLALLISNTTVTLSEFAGIASGFALFGIPAYVSVPIAAVAIWALTMSGSYHRIEKILLLISCAFVTYVVAGVMVGPDWGDALNATLIPRFSTDPQYFSVLVANIGTTIAPWMVFLAQSNVVEKNARAEDLPYQRIDTVTGSVVASAISWFIILTTGAVLFPAGIAVNGAEDAASALAPLVGPYAEALFGAGLVGASFLAACVLPGITSSAICEAFGWERGADRSWQEAPVYRGIIIDRAASVRHHADAPPLVGGRCIGALFRVVDDIGSVGRVFPAEVVFRRFRLCCGVRRREGAERCGQKRSEQQGQAFHLPVRFGGVIRPPS